MFWDALGLGLWPLPRQFSFQTPTKLYAVYWYTEYKNKGIPQSHYSLTPPILPLIPSCYSHFTFDTFLLIFTLSYYFVMLCLNMWPLYTLMYGSWMKNQDPVLGMEWYIYMYIPWIPIYFQFNLMIYPNSTHHFCLKKYKKVVHCRPNHISPPSIESWALQSNMALRRII